MDVKLSPVEAIMNQAATPARSRVIVSVSSPLICLPRTSNCLKTMMRIPPRPEDSKLLAPAFDRAQQAFNTLPTLERGQAVVCIGIDDANLGDLGARDQPRQRRGQ
jgi:hypothetical protein